MAPAAKFVSILVLVLSLVCQPMHAMSTEADFLHCRSIVQSWAESSLNEEVKVDKHTLQDLLFFLHIPRTGGRTYFYCFLRKLYTTYLECPRSYDKLRFDPSKPDCRLMVTHDDYSIMSKLPRERTSVVTILRNPVDRVFSTYEFSVEVAARFLVHPNLTSLMEMDRRIRAKTKGVSTLDIWPWKHLVPWMRDDLFARRDARKHGDFTGIRERNDPYNMEEVLMPLHDFINDDVAHDIIHNGATFQIAGLTNNSYLKEAHEVRRCVRNYHDLGEYVLNVAKRRLENMLYVGLTEEHKESATMFANVVGVQVISQLQMLSSSFGQTSDNETELTSPFPDSAKVRNFGTKNQQASQISSPKNDGTSNERLTVEELMEAYESCIPNLRKTQERRRVSSLQRISPANFTKKGRQQVPEDVLQKIISFNSLDVELYKHAQGIFRQQKNRLIQKSSVKVELQEKRTENFYEFIPRLKDGLLTITILLLLVFILLLLNSRTRLKMKLRKWFCSPH